MKYFRRLILLLCLLSTTTLVHAADFVGKISMVEVWRSGNVAFSLLPAISSCNGQVILNASDPGFKNQFAAVLAAREAGRQVLIRTYSCGPADNYGGSYNIPEYIYPLE